MQKTTSRHRTAADWSKLIQIWERSGQSASQFAASHGFSPKTLCWWRWRLGKGPKRTRERGGTPTKPHQPPRLVEVEIDEPSVSLDVAWALETTTAVLRVHKTISVPELDRVLAAMSTKGQRP